MKSTILSLLFLACSYTAYCQGKPTPDTLVIETPKQQKIILISDDVSSFRNINSDSLINVALRKVSDSLRTSRPPAADLRGLSKEERTEYFKRRDDSLAAIDGLTARERRKISREKHYSDKSFYSRNLKSNFPFIAKVNLGGGLIRRTFSPAVEAGIAFAPQRQDYYSLSGAYPAYTFMALTASRYYSFEPNAGNTYTTFNNTFLNFSLGNRINTKRASNYLVSEFEMGLGYLVEREGNYFGKNTFKLFGSVVTKSRFIRLSPELYFTNNFKEVFPGFSIKFH